METAQRVAVRRTRSGGRELAVFEFEGELRDLMVANLRSEYLATGSYAPDAKKVSPQTAASLMVTGLAAGGGLISAAVAPTLFLATANPATLMPLGAGVGSAVMGAGGIVGHASFLPVAASVPLVMPILAVQALNAAVMMREFAKIDRKLDAIKSTLDRAIGRAEATHVGELLAASDVIDVIYRQYELEGAFSQDMLVRLALAERDVARLASRFRQLVENQSLAGAADLKEVHQANFDAHCAMLASLLDLRVSYLRVGVDMQENPRSVAASLERLKEKIDDRVTFWRQLRDRSKGLKEKIADVEADLASLNAVERTLGKGRAEQDLKRLNAAYAATMESELEIVEGFYALVEEAKVTRVGLEAAGVGDLGKHTLVYWKDDDGEHSFLTENVTIDEARHGNATGDRTNTT